VRSPREKLSAAQARRVALAAQGFGGPRSAEGRALGGMVARLGLLQIDSVNVVSRAHYMPAYSRLGPYDRAKLDRMAHYAPRRLFEFWAHEASLVRVEYQPLLRWRMARAEEEAWGGIRRIVREKPGFVAEILDAVRERGPIAASELDTTPRGAREMWARTDSKAAMEWLFWSGQITSARRMSSFERLYDLPERVLPKAVLAAPTPAPEDAQRELVAIAARALGVASERDLRDYFRLPVLVARRAVAELVEAGELLPVAVEGWRAPGYLHRDARVPRAIAHRALVGPFDSLVFERDRTERLFGFRYRIEIYVPAEKRVHGYYVLPFLLGDALVARVDLKADRQAGVLRVKATHLEPGAPPETASELAAELELFAGWLELERVALVGG